MISATSLFKFNKGINMANRKYFGTDGVRGKVGTYQSHLISH